MCPYSQPRACSLFRPPHRGGISFSVLLFLQLKNQCTLQGGNGNITISYTKKRSFHHTPFIYISPFSFHQGEWQFQSTKELWDLSMSPHGDPQVVFFHRLIMFHGFDVQPFIYRSLMNEHPVVSSLLFLRPVLEKQSHIQVWRKNCQQMFCFVRDRHLKLRDWILRQPSDHSASRNLLSLCFPLSLVSFSSFIQPGASCLPPQHSCPVSATGTKAPLRTTLDEPASLCREMPFIKCLLKESAAAQTDDGANSKHLIRV